MTKMTTFSDEEKISNFLRIKEHIHILNTTKVTEDIIEDFKKHIYILRDQFWDFSILNPEITDKKFRESAIEAEVMISQIFDEMRVYKSFNITDYMNLLYAILKMSEFIIDENELSEMFRVMTFQ
jgi:ribosomal protein S8